MLQITTDTIFRYFQTNYGHVEFVAFHTIQDTRFANVTFGTVDSAVRALKQRQHKIDGIIVNVSYADQIKQQCNFLSLNDDCILIIFEYLECKNLHNIANVCLRLNALARKEFSLKYKSTTVTFDGINDTENIENCIRTFGSHIQSIYLKNPGARSPLGILHLLSMYCGSLKSLEMGNYAM